MQLSRRPGGSNRGQGVACADRRRLRVAQLLPHFLAAFLIKPIGTLFSNVLPLAMVPLAVQFIFDYFVFSPPIENRDYKGEGVCYNTFCIEAVNSICIVAFLLYLHSRVPTLSA